MNWFRINLHEFGLTTVTVHWTQGFIEGCGLFDKIAIAGGYISFEDEADAVQFELILREASKPVDTYRLVLATKSWERAVEFNQTLFQRTLRSFLKGPHRP